MIFQNIEFHNVAEMKAGEKGYAMYRVPESVRSELNEMARDAISRFSTGVELRFKIKGDSATVLLTTDEHLEAQVAYIYYGSLQGGWQYSSKVICTGETRITIPKPENLATLQDITEQRGLPFNPEVVRIVLPYGTCYFIGVEGEVEPPAREDVPSKTYLAYGSSITHGSLALAAPYTYPFRIARKLGCDYLNLGFAGSAHLEKAMAEYIVSRKDWDFASVEMGINMLGDAFTPELFEERVKTFVDILAADPRPVYATSIFGFAGGGQEKAAIFRDIVRKHAADKLIFTDGLDLLDNPAYISADLIHPTLEGIGQIAERWGEIMARGAKKPVQ